MKQSKSPRHGSAKGSCRQKDVVDIRKSEQAEAAARESESHYRAMVEAFDGLIYICSPDYRIEFMNSRLTERTGYDGTGEHCYKILHDRNSICPWCVNDRVFQGETVRWEVQSPKDSRWYYVVNTPIYDKQGRVSKQAILQDITELKKAEEGLRQTHTELERRLEERTAHLQQTNEQLLREVEERQQLEERLKESEELFLAFMQHLPGGAVIRDLRGQYLFANKAWEKAFAKKWQGKTLEEIWQGDTARHMRELDQKAIATGEPVETEITLQQEDGPHTWLINCFPILGQNGQAVLVGSAGVDLTNRRKAEEALIESEKRFRQLVEHAADAFFVHDRGKILEVNQQACNSLGYSREELQKMTVADLEVAISANDLQKSWEHPKSPVTIRGTHRRKDGSTFPVEVHAGDIIYGGRHLRLALVRDITERLDAEEALKQSEIKYRTLAEAAPSGISIIGKDGRYKYLNPKFEELFGYTLADIPTGREWFSKAFPDPSYREIVVADWKEEFKRPRMGEVKPRTFRVSCKDGATKVVNFRAVALAAGDYLIFYEDITKRVLAEEALRQSEENYRLLVRQIPAMVFKGYADGTVEFFDRKIESLTGYKKEDFDSGRVKWTDLILSEDAQGARDALLKALKEDYSYVREYRIRKKDGGILWIQGRGQIFCNAAGRIEYISGVFFDITQRKQAEKALEKSERLYRLLAENVSDVIWTADLNLRLTYVSPSVKFLRGFSPEEVMVQPINEILTAASLATARKTFADGMALEKTAPDPGRSWTMELEQLRKDGSTVWTEVKASFLRDEQVRPVGILGITRDISKRKEAESKLRRREAILEAVSIAAEKFLQSESWTKDIEDILRRLGESAAVSRAYIFENHVTDPGEILASQRYEWAAPGIELRKNNPQLQNLSWKAGGFGRWEEELSRGCMIVGHVRDFPQSEQEFLASQEIKSIVVMPMFAGSHWWGMIGFDAVKEERQWSAAELEALKAAASILGTAIQHEQGEQALRKTGKKLQLLTAELIQAQEKERKRLAAELHDELGHALLTLKLSIRSLEKELTPAQISLKRTANRILQSIGETIEGVRRLYHDLSPGDLEDLGLTTALNNMIEDFKEMHPKIKWRLDLVNLDGLFDVLAATVIYRVMQEALTNIGKHAQAKKVSLKATKKSRGISLIIEDDGKGFDSAQILNDKRTLGLLAMEERIKILGGSYTLWSEKNRGTRVSFTVPFPAEA